MTQRQFKKEKQLDSSHMVVIISDRDVIEDKRKRRIFEGLKIDRIDEL